MINFIRDINNYIKNDINDFTILMILKYVEHNILNNFFLYT